MIRRVSTGLLLASLLVGCVSYQAPSEAPRPPTMDEPNDEMCDASRVEDHRGSRLSDALEREMLVASQARQIRAVHPGESYTLEYRPDRLTVSVDAGGRVSGVDCG